MSTLIVVWLRRCVRAALARPALARAALPLRFTCALLLVLGLGAASTAAACTAVDGLGQVVDGTVRVANADPVGKRLGSIPWNGAANGFVGCSGRQPIEVELNVVGLTYVQDVVMSGVTYPAYAFDATSPLVIFQHNSGYFGGSSVHRTALRIGSNLDPNGPTPTPPPSDYRSQVLVYVISRGGVMTSVPYTLIGSATTRPQNFPALLRVISISLGIDVLAPTCRLSNTSLVLDDISADHLRGVGDSAGEKALEVAMRCPGAGISVGLVLADAHDPGNTGSVLSPTADSDAGGVRIELLNGGAPVQLGQRWEHGVSAGANETLFFGARYRRTADDLVPGEIKGEAILSADYR